MVASARAWARRAAVAGVCLLAAVTRAAKPAAEPAAEPLGTVLGIDLGTTYRRALRCPGDGLAALRTRLTPGRSCVGVYNKGKVEIIGARAPRGGQWQRAAVVASDAPSPHRKTAR